MNDAVCSLVSKKQVTWRGNNCMCVWQSGLTPLHVAAFIGNENIVSYLLDKGANTNSVTLRGETPLHYAARAGQPNIMRLLLDNGADLDAKSKAW